LNNYDNTCINRRKNTVNHSIKIKQLTKRIMKRPIILYLSIASIGLQLTSCKPAVVKAVVGEANVVGIAAKAAMAERAAAKAAMAERAAAEAAMAERAAAEAAMAEKAAIQGTQPYYPPKQVVCTEQEKAWISAGQINSLPEYEQKIYEGVFEATLNRVKSESLGASIEVAQKFARDELIQYNQQNEITMDASTIAVFSSSIGVVAYNTANSSNNSG
jgi:hypothetical protein